MYSIKILVLALLITNQMIFNVVRADVVELVGGLELGRFSQGVNLIGNELSVGLSGTWSANNGAFASLSCFVSENGERNTIQRGCDGSLGWFAPINDRHALTLSVSQHDYSSPVLKGWQYTDVSLRWHIGKTYAMEVQASDSLLGQGFSSLKASFHATHPLSKRWRANIEAGIISLQSSAPVSTLEYGVASLVFGKERWSTELKIMLSSSEYERFTNLDFNQPEFSVNFRYRIY